jgi:glycosyltransferase involved in cell wall biosynthesis
VRLAIASYHLPDPAGSAAGRILDATARGLLELGHEVRVWSWRPDGEPRDLPGWCSWQPLPPPPSKLRVRARALVAPRSEIVRGGWPFPDEEWRSSAIAIADEFLSFPAVAGQPRTVLTLHYATRLDAAALGQRSAALVQEDRAQRRAARRAGLVLAYSPRVADAAAAAALAVPAAYPVPPAPRRAVDHPTAAVLADWRWPPNRWALDRLLRAWPEVRTAVPSARLLLGGTGLDRVGAVAGVEVLGRVGASEDVLARAAALPFPCPPTSGPKVKVLEAMAHGLAVVTTPWGVEGVAGDAAAGAALVDDVGLPGLARALASVLADPALADELGRAGRARIVAAHAPVPAARARVAALDAAFGGSPPAISPPGR